MGNTWFILPTRPWLMLLRAALPLALPRGTHLILKHLQYSPHLQVLARYDTSGTRHSKTASDLLSFILLAGHESTSCFDQPKRLIPERLPRRGSPASARLDDAPGG